MSDSTNQVTPEIEYAGTLFFTTRTACLIDYSRGFLNPFGTAIFVAIAGKPYVFSAYHNWEKGKAYGDLKIASFHLSKAAGNDVMRDWLSPKDSDLIAVKFVNGVEVDLMALRLEQWVLDKHSEMFLDERLIDCDHVQGSQKAYYVAGYPTESYKPSQENSQQNPNVIQLIAYGTTLMDNEKMNADFSPGHHLALEYSTEMATIRNKLMPTPDPTGMSGGGIWEMTQTGGGIWAAEKKIRLVGIQYAWLKTARVLLGSQVKFLVEAIKKSG